MVLYLSKAIPQLLMPPGLNLVLFIAAWLLKRRIPKVATVLFVFSAVTLAIASSGLGSGFLVGSLEDAYPFRQAAELPNADAIVVLGGYLRYGERRPHIAEISSASDRLWFGAELYRQGKAPIVLLTGGNTPFLSGSSESEASVGAKMIQNLGVPANAVLVEGNSRNTKENAEHSGQVLMARAARRILLVTSAFHMRRASALFRHAGFVVIPAACDYDTGWGKPDFFFQLLPDSVRLEHSQVALREWIGLTVYRARGWL
jgi:uncharacterized SAM-binding protein YcdF (DUF218 family)